jgi:bacteriorhodopsin
MLESVITLLIYICVVALVIYLVIWVLSSVGVSLPPQVVKILWIIFALIVLLMLLRLLLPHSGRLFSLLERLPLLA